MANREFLLDRRRHEAGKDKFYTTNPKRLIRFKKKKNLTLFNWHFLLHKFHPQTFITKH